MEKYENYKTFLTISFIILAISGFSWLLFLYYFSNSISGTDEEIFWRKCFLISSIIMLVGIVLLIIGISREKKYNEEYEIYKIQIRKKEEEIIKKAQEKREAAEKRLNDRRKKEYDEFVGCLNEIIGVTTIEEIREKYNAFKPRILSLKKHIGCNCKNCGAPIINWKCEYCGSIVNDYGELVSLIYTTNIGVKDFTFNKGVLVNIKTNANPYCDIKWHAF